MHFIDRHTISTIERKQSKFISHLVPYASYTEMLKDLKRNHPKARHFVIAYRYLNEFKQVVEYSSDDGEPSGTSGKPTLMVLQGAKIINSAIITVRYFGGTRLGTGGLVRAYSDATNLALDSAKLLEYKEEEYKEISFEYTHLRKIEYECLINNIEIVEKIFDSFSHYKVKSDKENMSIFLSRIDRLVFNLSTLDRIPHVPHR